MCRHRLIVASSACLLVASPAQSVIAQAPPAPVGLSNTEDARVVPKGAIRLRVLTAWTRYDQVKGIPGGSQQLAALLNTDALGVQQLPGLGAAQTALRTLSGDANVTLSMGRLITTADSRIVTTPIMLEYGVTSRLALGVMVPVVQTRTTMFVELNPTPASSNAFNVGANPASVNNGALQQNTRFVQALDAARTQLAAELAACQSNPSGTVCTRQAEAQALIQTSAAYADAVAVLYGVSNGPVSTIAPAGALQAQIEARLGALNQQYESLLGSSVGIPLPPRGAAAAAAISQLQQLVTGPAIGLDSLATTERIGIGDVEVSAAFQLVDQLRDSVRQRSGGVRYRAALQGVARIGTGRPAPGTRALDVGLGTGQTSADARGILDVKLRRRFMATFAGQYTAYFGSAAVDNIGNANYAVVPFGPRTPGTWQSGNVIQLEVTPRFLLTDFIALNGHYVMRQQAAGRFESLDPASTPSAVSAFDATVEQRLGLGFAYSTLAGYARGRSSIPIELVYAHLQTVGAGGAAVPNYSRDQIEVRLYYQLRRRGR